MDKTLRAAADDLCRWMKQHACGDCYERAKRLIDRYEAEKEASDEKTRNG